MEQIQNIEQLIAEAMKISSKDERIVFVMNYFLNTVQYNYTYLFVKGYAQERVTKVDAGFRLAESKLNKEGITRVVLTRDITEGDSRIFRNILKLQEKSQGSYEMFKNNLRNYIKDELGKHIANNDIVTENTDNLIEKIENDLENKKMDVELNEKQYSLNYDISAILIDYFLNIDTNFPPKIKNGLINNGVCGHYTDYLLPIMEKIGVEAHKINARKKANYYISRDTEGMSKMVLHDFYNIEDIYRKDYRNE